MLYFRDFLLNVFHYQLLYYFFSSLKNNADDGARISPPVFDKMDFATKIPFLTTTIPSSRENTLWMIFSFAQVFRKVLGYTKNDKR